LKVRLALDCRGGNSIQDCLSIVFGFCLHPNRSQSRRFDLRDSIRLGDMICLCLRLGSSLNGCQLGGDRGGLRLLDSLCIIDDCCAHPDTCICRWLNNSAQLNTSDKVRLSFLQSFGSGIRLSVGLGVDVGLCFCLSGSESVLLYLGLVYDFSGHPNSRCGYHLDRRCNGSVCQLLDAGDDLSFSLMYRDGGWYDLSLSRGDSVLLGLCHCVAVVVARINIVYDNSRVTTLHLGSIPRLGLAMTVRRFRVAITTRQAFVASVHVRFIWHRLIDTRRGRRCRGVLGRRGCRDCRVGSG